MQGYHDEVKIFLEIRLIPSLIDQKLSFKGRNTLVLKRKLARRSWPIETVVEAVWRSHGSDSLGRYRGFPISLKYAWIWLQSGLKKTTFSATIGPRSGHDRGLIMTLSRRRSPADRGETSSRRSRAEISSIYMYII